MIPVWFPTIAELGGTNLVRKLDPLSESDFKLQANNPENVAAMATDGNKALAAEEKVEVGNDLEYLDIPAFLRKQAD